MNVYDFDKTIFYPDSSSSFYKFCLKKFPFKVIRTLPKTAAAGLCYAMHRTDAKELKEQLFSYLKWIPDVDKAVNDFWNKNEYRIETWYLEQKKDDDVIVSASPEFLLKPICHKLGVTCIGTMMDKRSGKIKGKNCHDAEKVLRFSAAYPGIRPEEFYSDSLTDFPMAVYSENAYLIKKHKIFPWDIDK